MSIPKGAVFGAELLGLTGAGSPIGGGRLSLAPEPVVPPATELQYLTYGGRILAYLNKQPKPVSERELYVSIKETGDRFDEFRSVLDLMMAKGVIRRAGQDEEFGDPLYTTSR